MPSARTTVLGHRPHEIAAIAVKLAAGSELERSVEELRNRPVVLFDRIVEIECREIGTLPALDIDEAQSLALPHFPTWTFPGCPIEVSSNLPSGANPATSFEFNRTSLGPPEPILPDWPSVRFSREPYLSLALRFMIGKETCTTFGGGRCLTC